MGGPADGLPPTLETYEGPPIAAKSNPRGAMAFVTPSNDDARQRTRPDVTEFDVDPEEADAAADLAGDLAAQFLQNAAYGDERAEDAGPPASTERHPFLFDEETRSMHEERISEDLLGDDREPPPAVRRPRRRG